MFLFVPAVALAAPVPIHAPTAVRANPLDLAFTDAADEFDVPRPLLMVIAWEASRWNPDAVSRWGGWGMYDLREGDMDPSLEHAGALLEMDPNVVATDWRQNIRGAAAILAEHGRTTGATTDDLASWRDALRAFSGREEPRLQESYVAFVYDTVASGVEADTRWGRVTVSPQRVETWPAPVPPPSSTDYSGAYQWVAASSSNYSDYSRTASDISYVIIHTVQGSYSGCISWFQNSSASVSAHYVVRSSDGQVTQMVHESDVAWHAGNWSYNEASVGIEHEGYVDDCGWYTTAMYAGSAALTLDIASRQGVSLDRSSIIGHVEVPGATHTDPGSCWDWDYYMGLLNGSTNTASGQIIGKVADSDIYNGAILPGADVWIAETGEHATVESDGYYRFDDIPFGTYTMHATYPGYAEGTCGPKTTSSSQDWCSIALFPDDTEPEDTAVDTDVADTDTDVPDTDTDVADGPDDEPVVRAPPGDRVRMDEVGGGCGCDAGAGVAALWLGALLAPLLARRRTSDVASGSCSVE